MLIEFFKVQNIMLRQTKKENNHNFSNENTIVYLRWFDDTMVFRSFKLYLLLLFTKLYILNRTSIKHSLSNHSYYTLKPFFFQKKSFFPLTFSNITDKFFIILDNDKRSEQLYYYYNFSKVIGSAQKLHIT